MHLPLPYVSPHDHLYIFKTPPLQTTYKDKTKTMPSQKDDAELETLRARWKHLYASHLPALALARDQAQPKWPVHLDHCFARIILDNAIGIDRPWNQVIKSPAVRTMTVEQFKCALDLGERVASGEADLVRLNEVSLGLRGKRGGRGVGREAKVGEKRKVADGSISRYFAPKAGDEELELELKGDGMPSQKRVKLEEEEEEEEEEKPSKFHSPESDKEDHDEPTTIKHSSEGDSMAAQIARITSSPTLTPFRKQTLTLLCRIPRGHWSTYQAMSDHITATSHKTCARAVGNAMRNNPFAPDVPCHRILSSDGSIGGFGGHWGAEGKFAGEKRELLREEGVMFDSKGKVKGQPFRDFGG
jgi:O-6-methylguanine DNA methyltransferase